MKHKAHLFGKYRYLFFDLDGTLTDPLEGIAGSAAYALSHFGIRVDDLQELTPFIGPPLQESFMKYYHLTEEQTSEAMLKYRERFADVGWCENKVYPGIAHLLGAAKQQGYQLMVATSKPEIFARRIINHFQLDSYFTFVGGCGLNGERGTKADVISYVLESAGVEDVNEVVMIGDRKHDVIGAKKLGMDSIGVLYGYGSEDELATAGADYIAGSIGELEELLLEQS